MQSFPPRNLKSDNPPEIPDDGRLVESVLRGDQTAFEQLVHRYQPALIKLATSKLRQPELAEEAVQETFMAALKSLHTYNSQFAFRTWLWTILINQCRRIASRQVRASAPEYSVGFALASLASNDTHPDEQVAEQESRQRLQALLRQISAVQATALRLRFFEGMKYQEIAEKMDSSLSAAKQRVRAGLQAIAEKMSRSEAGLPSPIVRGEAEHPLAGDEF